MLTRREMLATTAAVAASVYGGRALAQTPVLARPRVYGTTNPPALTAYKRAIEEMLKLPKTDPRNWYRQALVHICDCPHGNWWFLPWHRGYLARFEAICGELIGDPTFRLPYWDYTQSPSVPIAFWEDGLDPTKAPFDLDRERLFAELKSAVDAWWPGLTPEALADLATRPLSNGSGVIGSADAVLNEASDHWGWGSGPRGPTPGAPGFDPQTKYMVSREYLKPVLGTGSFTSFASPPSAHHSESIGNGLLESGPHDNVHGGTGGFMGAFMSPVDPLFWLHHANLDRLWDIWSRGKNFPDFTGLPDVTPNQKAEKRRFEEHAFRFFFTSSGAPVSMTTLECLSPSALGYSYEPGALSELAIPSVSSGSVSLLSVLGEAEPGTNRLFRKGLESSAAVSVARGDILRALESPGQEPVAQIKITPPKNAQFARVRVYLNCPYLSRFTPIDDPHYVGTISFFGALHHAGHDMPVTATLALGPALERLRADGKLPRSALRIQLIPETRDGDAPLSGGELEQVAVTIT